MTTITTPDALKGYTLTTVNFENIAALDGQEFGFGAGQPYTSIGLSFSPGIVDSTANLNSSSGHVGVRSDIIYTVENQNFLRWQFSTPQKAVGFFYRDLLATSVKTQAFDINQNVVEQGTFTRGNGYAGFVRDNADIAVIVVLAPHNTFDDASTSRTFIDDLSFSTTRWYWWWVYIRRYTWVWMILIGYILLTPIGPLCIVCDHPISVFWVRFLGRITLVFGAIGLWGEVTRPRTR